MHLGSGVRIQGVLNKALAGSCHYLCSWRLRYSFFPSSFHTHPRLNTQRLCSVSMPWCRGRSYIPHMLPIPRLPVVECCLSPPSYETELTNGAIRHMNARKGSSRRCSHGKEDSSDERPRGASSSSSPLLLTIPSGQINTERETAV